MALEKKLSIWIITIIMVFLLQYSSSLEQMGVGADEEQVVAPCLFIFGDSLNDNGNNNFLISNAKANFWPFGIDFPNGATGRFCNGRTTSDIIGQLLGIDGFIAPYATASGKEILKGVNYASAAAGIREESGRILGERASFSQQVNNYKTTVAQVVEMLGSKEIAADHFKKCIYLINLGSNDYINNYFLPLKSYISTKRYTPHQYASILVRLYSQQLEILYGYGARKFAIAGVGNVGSQPRQLAMYSPDGKTPIAIFDDIVQLFNYRLKKMVDRFNTNFTDANFIYLNGYDIAEEILDNPTPYGFKVIHSACCGLGRNNGEKSCPHGHIPCSNRSDHFFWDAFHPTEAANIFISKRFFRSQYPSDAYPFDLHTLALLS